MTRARLATSLLAIAVASQVEAAQVSPGEVAVAVSRGAEAVAGLTVSVDGKTVGTTDAAGRISFKTSTGLHRIVLLSGTTNIAFTEIRLGDAEAASLAVTLPDGAGDAKIERDIFNARDGAATTTAGTSAGKGAATLGTVNVKGTLKRQSTAQKERVATSVIDAVSQEEIAAAGDSNAGEALKRVTGVSVQDGVVVVRGLGDRYSTTLVNGAEIPSFNPSRRVVAADAFPSEFLGGLTVQKTYSADLPGEFSGGVALIETRPIPDFRTGVLRLNVGGNTQTTFSPVLTYRGSNSDYLGFDGGRRELPSTYRDITGNGSSSLSNTTLAERTQLLQSLPNLFDLRRIDDAPADFGGSLTFGDVYKLDGGQKIGFQVTGLYDTNFRFRREDRRVFQSVDGTTVAPTDVEELQRSEQTFETGGTFGVGVEFDKQNKIDFVTLLSRQTQKGAFFGRGTFIENNLEQERVTLDFVEGQLLANQLTGKHKFNDAGGLGVKWQAGYSIADRDVLDRRTYNRFRSTDAGPDEPFRIALGASNEGVEPRRSWEFLTDKTLDLGVDFSLPFEWTEATRGEFKFGARGTRRDRDFESIRLGYVSQAPQRSDLFSTAQLFPSAESLLIPLFFGPGGFDLQEVNSLIASGGNANIYDASQDVNAVYLLNDVFVGDQFEIQAGARLETSRIDVLTGNPELGATLNSKLKDDDILPSLNATWFVTRKQQLRLGASQSVNRPQFRELTPVEFLDPETRFLTTGNPNLKSAKLTNYDLRYEYYWSNSKAASVGVFYKNIEDPIEFNISSTSGGSPVRSFSNAQKAIDYGLELDARYDFSFFKDIVPLLSYTYIASNFSRIESKATLADGSTRQLQGQSNYLVNTTLGYSNPASRTDATLLFNVFGDRIAEVGFSGLPNAIEQSYPVLDFNLRQGIGRQWQVGIKARNLLNPDIEVIQGTGIQRSYRLGRSGQISLQYQF